MRFCLLEKLPDTYADCGVLYDISADRAIKNIITDKRKAEYFISILEKPLTNVENITFRQEIFDDLCSIDGLHEQLKTLFSRYDRIKSDWQEMKLGAVNGRGSDINSEALLEHTFSSLKVTAIFPSTIASFFASIGDTLGQYPIRSEGLTAIGEWCREKNENDALNELVEISQLFRYQTPDCFDFTVAVKLDPPCASNPAILRGSRSIRPRQAVLPSSLPRKKRPTTPYPSPPSCRLPARIPAPMPLSY